MKCFKCGHEHPTYADTEQGPTCIYCILGVPCAAAPRSHWWDILPAWFWIWLIVLAAVGYLVVWISLMGGLR